MGKDLKVSNSWGAIAYRRLCADHPDLFEQVTNYCMLGATSKELATFFNIEHVVWLDWVKQSRELQEAIEQGTVMADARVARAMYRRATGYEYSRQRLHIDKKGHATIIDLIEHVPPDTAAGKFWLTNKSSKWSDRQDHTHGGQGGGPIDHQITINFVPNKRDETLNITPPAAENDDD